MINERKVLMVIVNERSGEWEIGIAKTDGVNVFDFMISHQALTLKFTILNLKCIAGLVDFLLDDNKQRYYMIENHMGISLNFATDEYLRICLVKNPDLFEVNLDTSHIGPFVHELKEALASVKYQR
jgi:hypothetical protein